MQNSVDCGTYTASLLEDPQGGTHRAHVGVARFGELTRVEGLFSRNHDRWDRLFCSHVTTKEIIM